MKTYYQNEKTVLSSDVVCARNRQFHGRKSLGWNKAQAFVKKKGASYLFVRNIIRIQVYEDVGAGKAGKDFRFDKIPEFVRFGQRHRCGELQMKVDEKIGSETPRAEPMHAFDQRIGLEGEAQDLLLNVRFRLDLHDVAEGADEERPGRMEEKERADHAEDAVEDSALEPVNRDQ